MTATRPIPAPWGRHSMAALIMACGLMTGSPALAQGAPPPGFDSVPRPPGSIGPSQTLMPPGGSSGVLAPQTPSSPLQLTPPPAQPAALPTPAALPPAPPSTATVTPTVPMVPAGQVALMVNARFGKDPPAITGGLHWRVYADPPDASGGFRLLPEKRAAAPVFGLPPGGHGGPAGFGLA